MLFRIFLFITGFGLMVIGCTSLILYINLFNFGYTFKEYLCYILKTIEFYYIIIGFLMINFSILKGGLNERNKRYNY